MWFVIVSAAAIIGLVLMIGLGFVALMSTIVGEDDIGTPVAEGENPIRAWRQYRGLTKQELAIRAGIAIPFLTQIERGKCRPSISTMKKIARALEIDVEDLL